MDTAVMTPILLLEYCCWSSTTTAIAHKIQPMMGIAFLPLVSADNLKPT